MLQLRVEDIRQETADTATFLLAEANGAKVPYAAGQFITLVLNHHGNEIRRSYSLSSSPDEALLAITVKRVSNGEISRFMLSKVKKGDLINAVSPAGKFTLSKTTGIKNIMYLAAGSGIVPVFSHIKYLLARPEDINIVLFYSNNKADDILFNEALSKLQTHNTRRFTIVSLLSSEGKRLSNDYLEQLLHQHLGNNFTNTLFYICGPFAYMRMIRLTLLFMGVEQENIRKENFVIETVPVAESTAVYPPQNIKLQINNEVYSIAVGENQSILQAALQNNIALPYSCRGGMCSTCIAKCVSGKVEMSVNDVLMEADLAEGWVLTCTGHPVTDNVILQL
ncbi:flavin reductase family protein [Mucilaginibacter auburnensis]|uniref:Ring-1,2-phenylacetyl-CoA epoxidase subunit PaaE n=1 Tax=Mucilaginibacter auburnensis TaxID=1457233 RepID=A0A2H9VMY1_9SPHI|nr:iron-sulfur cluster-binding domain-containing protein [Mucilaginibacter auburnensis]PJJ79673.1 ring-1,2-phenylacetyl-CoA epoxidase subunit PaaE [Mucilaginibacter auburnensis]